MLRCMQPNRVGGKSIIHAGRCALTSSHALGTFADFHRMPNAKNANANAKTWRGMTVGTHRAGWRDVAEKAMRTARMEAFRVNLRGLLVTGVAILCKSAASIGHGVVETTKKPQREIGPGSYLNGRYSTVVSAQCVEEASGTTGMTRFSAPPFIYIQNSSLTLKFFFKR